MEGRWGAAGFFRRLAREHFRERAEVAEFYGFDTSRLTRFELHGYLEHMPRLRAWRDIRSLKYRGDVRLEPEQLHALVLAATEDEDEADRQAAAYLAARMRAEEARGEGA